MQNSEDSERKIGAPKLTITHAQGKGYSVGLPHGIDVGQDGSLNGINHLFNILNIFMFF